MKPDQKQTLRYRIVTKRLRRTQGVEGGGAEGSPIRRTGGGARGQSECVPRAAARVPLPRVPLPVLVSTDY